MEEKAIVFPKREIIEKLVAYHDEIFPDIDDCVAELKERFRSIAGAITEMRLKELRKLLDLSPEVMPENDFLTPLAGTVDLMAPFPGEANGEVKQTALLAYFLGNRDFGDGLINALVYCVGFEDWAGELNIIKVKKESIMDGGRLDVLCECCGKRNIIIEAKIMASESENQINKYLACGGDNVRCIYLTIDGDNADCEDQRYRPLSWLCLAAVFYAVIQKRYGNCCNNRNILYLKLWLRTIMLRFYDVDMDCLEKITAESAKHIVDFMNAYRHEKDAFPIGG